MNLKTTLALLVVIAAGGAAAWFGTGHPNGQPAQAPDHGSLAILEQLKPADILRVEIKQGDNETVLERPEGGGWTLPGKWPVRTREVDNLIELLGNLRPRFEPEALGSDPARFGLTPPAAGEDRPAPVTVV